MEKEENESWKEQARLEKERLDAQLKAEKEKKSQFPPEPTFAQFLTGLAAQALMALGEAENPLTKKKELDLPHAKYVIDVIALLKEKTRGNLSEAEQDAFNQILTDLRLRFVKASSKSKS
jgi:hypothetical protein